MIKSTNLFFLDENQSELAKVEIDSYHSEDVKMLASQLHYYILENLKFFNQCSYVKVHGLLFSKAHLMCVRNLKELEQLIERTIESC